MRLPPPPERQSSPSVNVIERELKTIKAAFQDYISTSKELEDGMDKELKEMRKFDSFRLLFPSTLALMVFLCCS